MIDILQKMNLSDEINTLIGQSRSIVVPVDREHLMELAMGDKDHKVFEVSYDIPGKGTVVEAEVIKCKNGAAVNYKEMYMRRRDPDCMVIGDDLPTDKETYQQRFKKSFTQTRQDTFEWLKKEELIVMPFMAGGRERGYESLLIAPRNCGFFALALADLQGFVEIDALRDGFTPRAVVFVAPPFRHTHFEGKQVVVHNRKENMHEIFAYNLYPGPSAKKGIYGVLLNIGEQEKWVTLHASTVRVITTYENVLTIMHEGASGGGKSEMAEQIPKDSEGRILLAKNLITEDKTHIEIKASCELNPVTDDMAMCHPSLQEGHDKLVVMDGEEGWFLRVNHITKYASAPHYEKMCIHTKEPLVFLNMQAAPDSTCLLWEHTIDEELGKPCPNPRVIIPRRLVPNIVKEPVEIDIRSFGVRTPMCTREQPSYGIMGMFHILPPALAWLWRLVAPRGHANPSILDSEGIQSEGVGSYWPFATGKKVDQANLLLEQILSTPRTRYTLIPNQHIGVYQVGFMPQWISREYLAKRGSLKFKREQLEESRCSLLGYTLSNLKVDGMDLPKVLLKTHLQPEIGKTGYDQGAKILTEFFKKELMQYLTPKLHPLGKEIIEACLNDAKIEDYDHFIPMRL